MTIKYILMVYFFVINPNGSMTVIDGDVLLDYYFRSYTGCVMGSHHFLVEHALAGEGNDYPPGTRYQYECMPIAMRE